MNQEATRFLVEAANLNESKVIFISSFAAINPTTLYGKTKLESERLVKEVKKGYLILRPSLILGYSPNTTNDRPFNRLLRNIENGKKVSYDTSWHFQPTWLKHVSEILREAIVRDIKNEIIPIAVSKVITRYQYAKDILSDYDIEVIWTNNENISIDEENLDKLKNLNLPEYTYEEMIDWIKNEIKEKFKY